MGVTRGSAIADRAQTLGHTDCSLFLSVTKRVLEAQVEKNPFLTVSRPDADRYRDAGNDLQTAREVIGPANAGVHVERVGPLCLIALHHGLHSDEHRFH